MGTTSNEDGRSIAFSSFDNSIYLAGYTGGKLDGLENKGGTDAFVVKYDESGQTVWATLIGSSNSESANSISASTGGSIFVTGISLGNINGNINNGDFDSFTAKIAPDGLIEWIRYFGGNGYDESHSIASTSDGGAITVGATPGNRTQGISIGQIDGITLNGPYDAFIIKYDEQGTKEWMRLLGSSSSDVARSVSTTADGSFYVTGHTTGSFGENNNAGGKDVFIAKYTRLGELTWVQVVGSAFNEEAYSIDASADGSIYVAGVTYGALDETNANQGSGDAFLLKLNSDGELIWSRTLGTEGFDAARSVSTDDTGKIFIVGETRGDLDGNTNSGSMDGFFAKYNPDGSRDWVKQIGTSFVDSAYAIDASSGREVYIVGSTDGDLHSESNNGWDIGDAFLTAYITEKPNTAPTDLSITPSTFNENIAGGSAVGTLSSTDANTGDTFTYSLVSGTSDTDNAAFTIDGAQLKINGSPDYETQASYTIRVRTTDAGGLFHENVLILGVNDLTETPSGGGDTTPPVPQSLELSTTNIDLSDGAVTITTTTRLTDDLSGVGDDNSLNAEIRWRSPSGNQFVDASFYAYTSGDDNDATFDNAFPITFNANSETGTWTIEYFRTEDEAGNQKSYTADELTTLGFNRSIEVSGASSSDTTPPVPQSLVLSTSSVDLSSGPVTITATTQLTDDLSGLGDDSSLNAEIRWRSPSGNQFVDAAFYAYTSGNDNDAIFDDTLSFNLGSEVGIWTIEYFRVEDEAGNQKSYSAPELQTLGFNRNIEVTTAGAKSILDFTDDGVVDSNDALLMMRHLVGTFPGDAITQGIPGIADADDLRQKIISTMERSNALGGGRHMDIDGDGIINPLSDGLAITQYIHGKGRPGGMPQMPDVFKNPMRGFEEMQNHLKDLVGF